MVSKDEALDIYVNFVHFIEKSMGWLQGEGIISLFGSALKSKSKIRDIDLLIIVTSNKLLEDRHIKSYVEIVKYFSENICGKKSYWCSMHEFLKLVKPNVKKHLHLFIYPTIYDFISTENPYIALNILSGIHNERNIILDKNYLSLQKTLLNYISDTTFRGLLGKCIRFSRSRSLQLLNTLILNKYKLSYPRYKPLISQAFISAIKYLEGAIKQIDPSLSVMKIELGNMQSKTDIDVQIENLYLVVEKILIVSEYYIKLLEFNSLKRLSY